MDKNSKVPMDTNPEVSEEQKPRLVKKIITAGEQPSFVPAPLAIDRPKKGEQIEVYAYEGEDADIEQVYERNMESDDSETGSEGDETYEDRILEYNSIGGSRCTTFSELFHSLVQDFMRPTKAKSGKEPLNKKEIIHRVHEAFQGMFGLIVEMKDDKHVVHMKPPKFTSTDTSEPTQTEIQEDFKKKQEGEEQKSSSQSTLSFTERIANVKTVDEFLAALNEQEIAVVMAFCEQKKLEQKSDASQTSTQTLLQTSTQPLSQTATQTSPQVSTDSSSKDSTQTSDLPSDSSKFKILEESAVSKSPSKKGVKSSKQSLLRASSSTSSPSTSSSSTKSPSSIKSAEKQSTIQKPTKRSTPRR